MTQDEWLEKLGIVMGTMPDGAKAYEITEALFGPRPKPPAPSPLLLDTVSLRTNHYGGFYIANATGGAETAYICKEDSVKVINWIKEVIDFQNS